MEERINEWNHSLTIGDGCLFQWGTAIQGNAAWALGLWKSTMQAGGAWVTGGCPL